MLKIIFKKLKKILIYFQIKKYFKKQSSYNLKLNALYAFHKPASCSNISCFKYVFLGVFERINKQIKAAAGLVL